jgi:hypothetical protein
MQPDFFRSVFRPLWIDDQISPQYTGYWNEDHFGPLEMARRLAFFATE